MEKIIGIRREDKNKWERRVPLIPGDVKELKEKHGIKTIIQPSKIRIFSDEEYEKAGATVSEDMSAAQVILAVKEIPTDLFEEGKTYMFFSHTIKGQDYNMDMLRLLKKMKCNLIDYERVVDDKNRRLIFFGKYAGLAGMIDTLHALGQKTKLQGYDNPLSKIKPAYQYDSLEHAKIEIDKIGKEIDEKGIPQELCPLVVGFAGYGNVSRGAQEIFDILPHKTVSAHIIDENYENFSMDNFNLYKVVFNEEDMVFPKDENAVFALQDYYDNPDKYVSRFESYIPYLSVLVNCIYWTEDYPLLVTKEYLKNETVLRSNLTLKVIGDISCDIDGSVEITYKATKPDNPTFTYFANEDRFEDGVHMTGVAVMAVDNLPCEFSAESSTAFSTVLKEYVESLASADFSGSHDDLKLAAPIKRAQILHKGEFTTEYEYMKEYLK
ncbi:MAG: hypothetical protein GY757_46670 [bacterium]|nr:hypothetical protein [bacterium]